MSFIEKENKKEKEKRDSHVKARQVNSSGKKIQNPLPYFDARNIDSPRTKYNEIAHEVYAISLRDPRMKKQRPLHIHWPSEK